MTVTLDSESRLKQTGRNDDCPCGSGKKYKKCHLREDEASVSKGLATKLAEAVKAAEADGGHVHDENCEHPTAPAMKPQASAGPAMLAPNKPMNHKPVSTPRKAV